MGQGIHKNGVWGLLPRAFILVKALSYGSGTERKTLEKSLNGQVFE
jgi:hypothetical protein